MSLMMPTRGKVIALFFFIWAVGLWIALRTPTIVVEAPSRPESPIEKREVPDPAELEQACRAALTGATVDEISFTDSNRSVRIHGEIPAPATQHNYGVFFNSELLNRYDWKWERRPDRKFEKFSITGEFRGD